jgi:Tfp pilus assembly protein PilV
MRAGGGRPGWTLIEAAVAMAIVLVVALPASKMYAAAVEANAATEQQVKALILAQLVLESRIRVVPFDQQQAATGFDPDGDLNWTLTLTPVATNLRKARVEVRAPGQTAVTLKLEALSAKEN